jgi:hypothetical protein
MFNSPVRNRFLVVLVLATLSGGPSPYGQEPSKPAARPISTLSLGSYYALLIGINNYQHLTKLQTPVNDAKALAKLLKEEYGFETKTLLNGDATREKIFDLLFDYEERLPVDSNLLIFYAGHGYHDPGTDAAYWIPVDAQNGSRDRWISAIDITTNIRAIHSKHILIISDSCYSGALTREANAAIDPRTRGAYLAKMVRPKSRDLMSSGGDEPVADGGAAGHSVFANAVLKSLTEIQEEQFAAGDLFQALIKRPVAGNSDQVPQYKSIQNSGDESGDFVFSRGGKGLVVRDAESDYPSRRFQSEFLPDIACNRELTPQSVGSKIPQGDIIDCRHLDHPLKWLQPFPIPELLTVQTKSTVKLTLTVDEEGWVIALKPRGGEIPQDLLSALKTAAHRGQWQTNPPTYQGKHVPSSFALDLELGQ